MLLARPSIYFHYLGKPFYFPRRTLTKNFLLSIFKKHSKTLNTANYIFCSDEYLLALNKTHLRHDHYTDIITFELSEPHHPLLADIYISVERARENAKQFHVTLQNEMLRLLIHGTLHLCGYRDKSQNEIVEMRKQEAYYLNKYFVSRETNT
jgi:rRNA maturation RNase YbeY